MKKYLDIFVAIIIFSLGFTTCYLFFPRTIVKTIPGKEKIVTIEGKIQTKTIVKYVPKETDPKTGQLENTDVEMNIQKPGIDVKVNGKEYIIEPIFNESQIFESGKLVFDQGSSLSLDLTLPKPERKIELGGYIGLSNFGRSIGGTLLIPNKNVGSQIIMGGINLNLSSEKLINGWNLIYSRTW